MKKIFNIVFLLLSVSVLAQTGPATTVNGKVTYNYRATGSGNTTYLTVDPVTNELEFQPAVSGIPLATPSTAGIAKLYTSTGVNTDGSVTQQAITDALFLKAPLASPAFTGTPTVPTASQGTNTTQAASTAFVQSAVNAIAIKEWSAGTYSEGDFVRKEINGQQYLFRSTSSSNITEPLLNKQKAAWATYYLGGVYIGVWSNATAYVAGNIVDAEGFLYYCITGHTNSNPVTLTAPYWFKIGQNFGAYNPATIYPNGAAIINANNTVSVSNYDKNNYAVNYGVVSKWEVINGDSFTVTCWGNSLTFGSGSTGYGDYPNALSLMTGFNIDNQGVPGETSTQIKNRFNENPDKWRNATIFEVGRNNYSDLAVVIADLTEMINKLGHDRFLIVNIIKAHGEGCCPVEDLNSAIKAAWPEHVIDLQSYLMTVYDNGLPQDVADHADGEIAWSLLSDWLHLNNKGYYHFAKLLATKKGILTGESKISNTDIQTGSVHVTGNYRPMVEGEGGNFFYIPANNESIISTLDYSSGSPVAGETTIGNATNEIVNLAKNSGKITLGKAVGLPDYSSGTGRNIMVSGSNNDLVLVPSLGTGYVPYQNENGFFSPSPIYTNGSGETGIGTTNIESGYKQQSESYRYGTAGMANGYGGSLNADFTYHSSRLGGDATGHKEYVTKFIISPTNVTDTNSTLQVNGTISATNAVDSDEVVPLGQMNTALALKADKTGTSDIEITDSTKGIILKDTVTATRYRIQVVSGVVTATALP